ncbi:MAG: UPF0280 family protein [Syntrophomonadaceae bacterium]|jgi:ApbE superfamily uncharacterized protein (UPF0280 family)|nr:UPF0280 family protein [Syntrophomonadaceae bacterium]
MNKREEYDYVNRHYRSLHEGTNLKYYKISIRESDLAIGVDKESYTDSLVSWSYEILLGLRMDLEDYIKRQPEFKTSLAPIYLLAGAPEIVRRMNGAAWAAGVGPMAAVAGAIAQALGEQLLTRCGQVVVENGGDIFLSSESDRIIAVFAGPSKFTYKIGIKIKAGETPLGICTSSGTVGPSLSWGRADAVVITGFPTALSDAVATAAANRVKTSADLMKAIEMAQKISGITGILAIKEDTMAAWGKIEVVPINRRKSNESG